MEKGKQKCEQLKSICKAFAEANGIDYTPSVCSSTEECNGTCPKCEAEAEYIMNKVKEKSSSLVAVPDSVDGTPGTIDQEIEIVEMTDIVSCEEVLSTRGIIIEDESILSILGESDLPDDIIVDVTSGDISFPVDDEIIDLSSNDTNTEGFDYNSNDDNMPVKQPVSTLNDKKL